MDAATTAERLACNEQKQTTLVWTARIAWHQENHHTIVCFF